MPNINNIGNACIRHSRFSYSSREYAEGVQCSVGNMRADSAALAHARVAFTSGDLSPLKLESLDCIPGMIGGTAAGEKKRYLIGVGEKCCHSKYTISTYCTIVDVYIRQ